MAARWNSSRAPVGPPRRMRSNRRVALSWAKQHLDLLPLIARALELRRSGELTRHREALHGHCARRCGIACSDSTAP